MTTLKKIVCLALIICLASATLFAQSNTETTTKAKTYNVGICQLVQHAALDAASQGFMDAIDDAMGKGTVKYDYQNASADAATCTTIVNGFVASNVDLILANATLPLQTAAAATGDIPILGTSVTNYQVALDMPNMGKATGVNISGCSDLAPIDEQAKMIVEIFPNTKQVGLLYCSAEPNSVYQIELMEEALDKMGINHTRYAFADSNDVGSVTASACEKSEVIYIPTDNTAASCTEAVRNIVEPARIPVIAGEEGICSGCGIATLSISYYDLGYSTGKMAVEVLNGADISKMEIRFADKVTKKYNEELCQLYGITVPADYVKI
ncbi:MAG: ABC transporter substrate-binding protein [Sphaerochaetaceae bacterium]|nr:ABC transporter substrate-binding protein [Sphaerochaetaceae bacterium]